MQEIVIDLANEAATQLLGQDLGMALRQGDVIGLSGGLGAGKSTLARAALRALASTPDLEVPSPTYTLCQKYELQFPVFHFDFYRLSSADELEELGFEEACQSGAVLIEWPQIAAARIASSALQVKMAQEDGGGRIARISGGGSGPHTLAARFERSCRIRQFLDTSLGKGAERRFLQGDASSRRYETVHHKRQRLVLMDAPRKADGAPIRDGKPYSQIAHLAEDIVPFIAIAETLHGCGLAAPAIVARSVGEGLLLIEHLGDGRLTGQDAMPLRQRYQEAARLLAFMHQKSWPHAIEVDGGEGTAITHKVPRYDRGALMIEASLLADWYAPQIAGRALPGDERARFDVIWDSLISQVETSMPTLVLRDFHSPNLIWRARQAFPKNIGLIDFQDAVIGPQAYDLASLAQDARVDISPALENAVIGRYLELRRPQLDFDETAFRRDYAIMAAHRATKILGIFVRLNLRDGKPAYLRHLPRMRDYLERNLQHEALGPYHQWCVRNAGFAEA